MAGFKPLRTGLGAVAIAALVTALWPTGCRVLAQSAEGGIAGSADNDTPDIPIPSTAHATYSPIVEGFASPLDPRAELRATQPPKPPPQALTPPAHKDAEALVTFRLPPASLELSSAALAGIRTIAHGLAGAAGIYGFAEISDAAGALENDVIAELAGGSPRQASQALERLLALLASLGDAKSESRSH